MTTNALRVDVVRTDGGTQSRAALDTETIGEYAAAYTSGAVLPPPVVFYDGTTYWVADGFHRIFARRQAGFGTVDCDVRQGTHRDAVLYSVGANTTHGLPRKNVDKRCAVATLLSDAEWSQKSDRWIAERCAVSDPFVGKLRAELQTVSSPAPAPAARVGKDGKTRALPQKKQKPALATATTKSEPVTEPEDDEPTQGDTEQDEFDAAVAAVGVLPPEQRVDIADGILSRGPQTDAAKVRQLARDVDRWLNSAVPQCSLHPNRRAHKPLALNHSPKDEDWRWLCASCVAERLQQEKAAENSDDAEHPIGELGNFNIEPGKTTTAGLYADGKSYLLICVMENILARLDACAVGEDELEARLVPLDDDCNPPESYVNDLRTWVALQVGHWSAQDLFDFREGVLASRRQRAEAERKSKACEAKESAKAERKAAREAKRAPKGAA